MLAIICQYEYQANQSNNLTLHIKSKHEHNTKTKHIQLIINTWRCSVRLQKA